MNRFRVITAGPEILWGKDSDSLLLGRIQISWFFFFGSSVVVDDSDCTICQICSYFHFILLLDVHKEFVFEKRKKQRWGISFAAVQDMSKSITLILTLSYMDIDDRLW